MSELSDEAVRALIARADEIVGRMGSPDLDPSDYVQLSKDHAELEPVAALARRLTADRAEAAELDAMAGEGDPELRRMATDELRGLTERLDATERDLALALVPKDRADAKPAILEIRAGTGGDEAALFAGDLFRMYQRYAEERGWRVEPMEASPAELGGYKEVVASVTGTGVFGALKWESGVHRVQRVPATESGGRIHTSAATVAVLPEAEEVDVEIADGDLRVDIYRSSGAGGQHVNTTDSAVRLTHLPTGITVACQDGRSQHKNKAKAMTILRSRLYEHERERVDSERAGERRAMVGSGDRSQRIRTYNYPQGRVTDHRINLTLHSLSQVMEGKLGELIDALAVADEADRLAALDAG